MKKLFFFVAFVAMSMLSMAQVNQLVWANGRLLYGTPVESIDSLTYDEMQDVDTLHLLLPRTLVKVVHDTVVETRVVHDTVVEIVHDTVYVNVPCGDEDNYNGHEYVDLGLSVKWATCNVGANAPEEYGDYFAWGEVEPKESYDWSTYKWCNGSNDTQTKYCTNSSYGTVDNKTVLDKEDDAAAVNWGGAWRMPTTEEQDELRSNCIWTWTTQNGVNGCIVTGPNGNSIFFPAAGNRNDSDLYNAGSYCYYWSSSLAGRQYVAYSWSFDSSSVVGRGGHGRKFGLSVRPVCQ